MFSRPKILFLVSLLFVALLNPKLNPYLLFKFLIFYHSSICMFCVYVCVVCMYVRMHACMYVYMYAKQKQPGCKKSARPIRSHNGYKRPKSLISSKAKKLNILLRILLLE